MILDMIQMADDNMLCPAQRSASGSHLTSLRCELCSEIRSLFKVWMEAVAEFFRVWRALMSWLRGNSICTHDNHLQ